MKELPIPFQPAMVRALLRDIDPKTQTRRVVKPLTADRINNCPGFLEDLKEVSSPYGQPGDRLWVREAWRAPLAYELTPPRDIPAGTPIVYQADGAGSLPHFNAGRLRPGMFMPRWASRILLEVTEVRVERLQDISEADAIAEGIENDPRLDPAGTCHWRVYGAAQSTGTNLPERSYESLWEQINGPGSWDANPWVWVVGFRRLA